MKPVQQGCQSADGDAFESSDRESSGKSQSQRWARRIWSACFGARLDQQQWTWFLRNPMQRQSIGDSGKEKEACETSSSSS